MESKLFSTLPPQPYTSLWNKYRPALLQLMVASAQAPQQYKLFSHEFKALNPKQKNGYSFVLQVFKGKAVNNIKTSEMAQDLLSVLNNSKKASELMGTDRFEFSMDKQFMLHISKMPPEQQQ